MKPETTEALLELMNGAIFSAVLGAAMELGLFWVLAEKPRSAREVAHLLSIPFNRCHHWLQILAGLGLLENTPEGYAPSGVAREAILDAQSQEMWAFQTREDRDIALFVRDLAVNLRRPMSAWQMRELPLSAEPQKFDNDPLYAKRFTRKLYEIHLSLAEQLAAILDLSGVRSLLDLGGGSGVVSFALLRKQPKMTAVVVDVENVCRVGRELALENGLEDRIVYEAGDLSRDDLPTGFDLVMLCDVGNFDDLLFRKIHQALNPNGLLVIVDKFALDRISPPPSRLLSAFLDSLQSPSESMDLTTVDVVQSQLQAVGFGVVSISSVPNKNHLPWNMDWTMLQARKQAG